MADKIRLTKDELRFKLIECFESGITTFGNCWEHIGTTYAVRKQRVNEMYNECYPQFAKEKEKKTNETLHQNIPGVLEIAHKTAIHMVVSIEKQIEDLKNELIIGITKVHTFVDGVICIGERPMNSNERANIHKVIKELKSEINKIRSYYAPTKLANTTAAGDDVNQITISIPSGLTLDFPSNTDESTT